MASHNRRATTLACLESLCDQQLDGVNLEVFLLDDASTDGTPAAVAERYPKVHLIEGSGELYWSGGMALAQQAATATDPDFLMWLNDDVRLAPGALATMLATHGQLVARGRPPSIVVGALADPTSGTTTYSGVMRHDRLRRMRFTVVAPSDVPQECEAMHGNLVVVPRSVYRRIGGFDPGYRHAMNDLDYGLRTTERGCEVWLAPGHLGTCPQDHDDRPWADTSLPLSERARLLVSPKGLPPGDWLRFTHRHGGPIWPALFVGPYVRFCATAARKWPADRSGKRRRRAPAEFGNNGSTLEEAT